MAAFVVDVTQLCGQFEESLRACNLNSRSLDDSDGHRIVLVANSEQLSEFLPCSFSVLKSVVLRHILILFEGPADDPNLVALLRHLAQVPAGVWSLLVVSNYEGTIWRHGGRASFPSATNGEELKRGLIGALTDDDLFDLVTGAIHRDSGPASLIGVRLKTLGAEQITALRLFREFRNSVVLGRAVIQEGYSIPADFEVDVPLRNRLLDPNGELVMLLNQLESSARQLDGSVSLAEHSRIRFDPSMLSQDCEALVREMSSFKSRFREISDQIEPHDGIQENELKEIGIRGVSLSVFMQIGELVSDRLDRLLGEQIEADIQRGEVRLQELERLFRERAALIRSTTKQPPNQELASHSVATSDPQRSRIVSQLAWTCSSLGWLCCVLGGGSIGLLFQGRAGFYGLALVTLLSVLFTGVVVAPGRIERPARFICTLTLGFALAVLFWRLAHILAMPHRHLVGVVLALLACGTAVVCRLVLPRLMAERCVRDFQARELLNDRGKLVDRLLDTIGRDWAMAGAKAEYWFRCNAIADGIETAFERLSETSVGTAQDPPNEASVDGFGLSYVDATPALRHLANSGRRESSPHFSDIDRLTPLASVFQERLCHPIADALRAALQTCRETGPQRDRAVADGVPAQTSSSLVTSPITINLERVLIDSVTKLERKIAQDGILPRAHDSLSPQEKLLLELFWGDPDVQRQVAIPDSEPSLFLNDPCDFQWTIGTRGSSVEVPLWTYGTERFYFGRLELQPLQDLTLLDLERALQQRLT